MKNRACNLIVRFLSMIGLTSAVLFLSQSAPAAQVIQTLPFYDSFDYTPNGLYTASPTGWETWGSTGNIYVTNVNLTLPGFVPSAGNSAAGTSKIFRYTGTQFTSQTAAEGKTVFV